MTRIAADNLLLQQIELH